ncbi:MAG: hypothetical protein QNJ19_00165 [Woeseiaceae bacterium]|nr:hypothetical protein [Woeseiaceae bacterium]
MSENQKGKTMISRVTALLLLLASGIAMSQGTLEVQTTVQKEAVTTNEDGERIKELIPAETVVPGERVVYTITFRNTGEEPADDVIITNPISEELTYVQGSAFGPGMELQFSVDGQSFGAAEDLTVEEDGETRTATPEDYTHIRWVMQSDLSAGAQGTVRFSAQLN